MAEIFAQFSKNMPYWCRSKCSMNCDSLVWTYPEACSDNGSFSFPELGPSGERKQHRREGLCFLFLLCPIFFLLFLILLFSQHCLPQSPKLNMVHQRKKQQRNGKRGLYLCSSLQKMIVLVLLPTSVRILIPSATPDCNSIEGRFSLYTLHSPQGPSTTVGTCEGLPNE